MYIYIARGPGFESHSGQLSIWNRKTLPQYEYHIYLYIFYIYIYIYICIYCTHHTFQNFDKNYISQLYIGKIENKKFFCDN